VVFCHTWVLSNAVHDESESALFVLLGRAVNDAVDTCADTLLPTRARSKRSMMHPSHHGLGSVSPLSSDMVECTGRGGLVPQLSQTGSGVFAILGWGSGVFSMLGERAGRYVRERRGGATFNQEGSREDR
jgi:hypothetical protein